MNPLKIIRWKLLLVLVVLVVLFLTLGMPRALDAAFSKAIEQELLTTATTKNLSLSLFSGKLAIDGLVVADPAGGEKPLFAADEIRADVSVVDLLRRKVVIENLVLKNPSMHVSQRPDGSLSIEEKQEEKDMLEGLDPAEVARKVEELYGRMEEGRDWVQRIRKMLAHINARKELEEEARREGRLPELEEMTPLPEMEPRFVVEVMRVEGMELSLEGEGRPPGLKADLIEALDLNFAPLAYGKVTRLAFKGLLGNESPAPLLILSRLAPKSEDVVTRLDRLELANLDVTLLNPLIAETLPIRLLGGRIALNIKDGWIRGDEAMDVNANILLKDIRIAPREGYEKLAGFDAATLCQAVSDAGTFELQARLTGSPLDPEVDVSNTMNLLMKMGARAFSRMALQQLEQRYGKGFLQGLSGDGPLALPGLLTGSDSEGGLLQGLGGFGGGLKDLLQKGLQPAGGKGGEGGAGRKIEELLQGGKKGKNPLKAIEGLFGGKKKKK